MVHEPPSLSPILTVLTILLIFSLNLRSSTEEPGTGWTPLHLCSQWGFREVIEILLAYGAAVNKKDAQGKTPLHLAIENHQEEVVNILLHHSEISVLERDNRGSTPFATAITAKFNKAASAILDTFPTAAEQVIILLHWYELVTESDSA